MTNYEWIREMLREQGIEEYLSVETVKKVYLKLIEVAKKKQPYDKGYITYEEIMSLARINRENTYEREVVLGIMLGGISAHEHDCGRPMLSAVVVHKPNKEMGILAIPGDGFFKLAYDLGLYDGSRNQKDKMKFWSKEIKRVWDYWSKK
ncbi:MAG: hypothetical protein QXJ20_02665 [Candidatus Aenigmatarchaeota archaeon]